MKEGNEIGHSNFNCDLMRYSFELLGNLDYLIFKSVTIYKVMVVFTLEQLLQRNAFESISV